MLELKLPEVGTATCSYQSENFKYELLLNLSSVRLSGHTGDRIDFELSLKDPEYPRYPKDTLSCILPKSILQEEGYQKAEQSDKFRGGNGAYVESFVDNYTTKTLTDFIAESLRQENGKLLLFGRENRENSYYAHRSIYVLPAITGVGIVDIRAGTCPGRFVRAFCSDEIDTARKERIKERVISHFVKSS